MMSRRFVSLSGPIACLTILVYLGLVVPAGSCVSMSIAPSGAHHQSQESAHSSLCVWSCQMSSQSGLVASAPTVLVSLVAISAAAPLIHSHAVSSSASRFSRAPPVFTLG